MPAEQLDTLPKKFKEILARIVKDGIDMTRMATVLERQKLSLLNSMETDGADVLSDVVVAGKCSAIHLYRLTVPPIDTSTVYRCCLRSRRRK